MFLTVRDRSITAVQQRLLTIQEANGYSVSITGAYRRADVDVGDVLPEIALFFGQATQRYVLGNEDKIQEVLAVQVRFAADRPDDDAIPQDRGYDQFVGDIQRCLTIAANPQIVDLWYSRGEIRMAPKGDRIFYSQVAGVSGVAFYEMTYWYMASDNRKWDGQDRLISEDQLLDVLGEVAA